VTAVTLWRYQVAVATVSREPHSGRVAH